ncbi:hypothetical protein [Sabulibacter ruber]|uniref:hypothetical protein n=1 Tax=Sabulibacter ruber TaxID=2811901 RepID=UPI001A976BBB|nr:hypothetical protein [Sabulibacter ruber]
MKKPFTIFLFLLILLLNFKQKVGSKELGREIICQQLKAALWDLKNNDKLKGFELKFDNRIRDGWGFDGPIANIYTAKKLNVKPEDLWSQDKDKIGEIFKSFEDKPFKSGSKVKLDCLPKSRHTNTIISKLDNSTMLLHVTYSRLGNEGLSGVIYLFFFDEFNNVESFYETSWIS